MAAMTPQKTMGIIAVLLYSQGMLDGGFHVPFWVVLSCQAAMGIGTLFGGWRIVHTVGSRITRLTPQTGVLRGNGRRHHPLSRHTFWGTCFDYPYNHRRNRRR